MATKPKFHVSNFGGNITIQMNKDFACLLFDILRPENGEVPPELYALSEKIENQFFFMKELTLRKASAPIPAPIETQSQSEPEVVENVA
jgi:hypothetical protein